ncbi:hypothetical protein NPIL_345051 [Nephila pilipes]|uniref:Uncharacterized protein n=1 Tax=Nephila pilipes TaxID=299642 RepID=A0A8X6TG51_NEPPI|nr:hypothetical protein NPIL_345051 [Nephila pilipes]
MILPLEKLRKMGRGQQGWREKSADDSVGWSVVESRGRPDDCFDQIRVPRFLQRRMALIHARSMEVSFSGEKDLSSGGRGRRTFWRATRDRRDWDNN